MMPLRVIGSLCSNCLFLCFQGYVVLRWPVGSVMGRKRVGVLSESTSDALFNQFEKGIKSIDFFGLDDVSVA